MSRHRNLKNIVEDEDYDNDDDDRSHSLDDRYGTSPVAAEYMHSGRGVEFRDYMRINEEVEGEDEDHEFFARREEEIQRPFQNLTIQPQDRERFNTCMDQLRDVLAAEVPESTMKDAIVKCNYDANAAINLLLSAPREDEGATPLPVQSSGSKPTTPYMEPPRPTASATDMARGSPRATPKSKASAQKEGGRETVQDREPSRSDRDRNELLRKLQKEGNKEVINLIVIGHVDAGKSTLVGHLLYVLGEVSQKQMHRFEQDSRKAGKASFAYAWALDETEEERERGVTMDIAPRTFETETRRLILLDAPGHRDFIPNMLMGASSADAALLVLSAVNGEFESGFESGGQTREHALLARSLGVSQLIVAVNKLDTAQWARARYDELRERILTFLIRQAGFREQDLQVVPVSGLTGDNLLPSSKQHPIPQALADWYSGPALLDCLDRLRPPERLFDRPLRIALSDVYKVGSGLCVSGKVETGFVTIGDRLMTQPAGLPCTVKTVLLESGEPKQAAGAGDLVTLTLNGLDLGQVLIGAVVSETSSPCPSGNRLRIRVVVIGERPLTVGQPLMLHIKAATEPATVRKIISQIDKATGDIVKKGPRSLPKGSTGEVELKTQKPICAERFADCKELGRCMLRYGGTTIAAGIVLKVRIDNRDSE